ncbi:MAG: hypothetical protein QM811_27875 [Pirellulales bacterium]
MFRFARLGLLAASACWLMLATAFGQGVLVHIQPDDHIPLPRPIIIYPPYPPHPIPRPRPTPPPPESTYKIKSLEFDAKLTEQVATVQVAQNLRQHR